MMKITLKLVCSEIFGAMPNGEYTIPGPVSVREAVLSCVEQYGGGDVLREHVHQVVYMLNGRQVTGDATVKDGDSLFVLRPIFGG